MAGGTNPKGSSVKPSSTSSAAPPRKSRWEPASNNHPTTTKPPANDSKPSKSNKDPSPKTGPTPSPANLKPPHSGANSASVPSPGVPFPFPDPAAMGPPPPPVYGFHMLERRTIVLADGSVRSYFALPPDYQDFPPTGRFLPLGPGGGPMPEMGGFDRRFPPGGAANPGVFHLQQDYWNSLGLDGRGGEGSMKRKFGEEEEKDRRRDGSQNGVPDGTSGGEDLRASKHMRTSGGYDNGGYREIGGSGVEQVNPKYLEVDQNELKKAFLRFAKLINENSSQKKSFLENGKHGRVQCLACSSSSSTSTSSSRSSKDFTDTHSLVMHTYYSTNADLRVDHLGLHKALCVLMGWNYSKSPENSKTYQVVSAEEAAANRDDLIIWPPMVIIHNTITAKNKDGRMEGMGNKLMDTKIRELGFPGGKSKSLYGREGHLGMTLVKFASDQAGLKEAIRLAEHFDEDNRGRKAWALLQPLTIGTKDDENNPRLMTLDPRTHNKRRVLYGYLGTASDVDKLDYETKKKVVIESYREYKNSSK